MPLNKICGEAKLRLNIGLQGTGTRPNQPNLIDLKPSRRIRIAWSVGYKFSSFENQNLGSSGRLKN